MDDEALKRMLNELSAAGIDRNINLWPEILREIEHRRHPVVQRPHAGEKYISDLDQPDSGESPSVQITPDQTSTTPFAPQSSGGIETDSSSGEPAWYLLHCYQGMEERTVQALQSRIEERGIKHQVIEIVIPQLPVSLNDQERKVLLAILEGKRDADIAQTLFLGEGTTRILINATFEKLGVSNRLAPLKDMRSFGFPFFPGCLLVFAHLDRPAWSVLRNSPGVTGFHGIGDRPTQLKPKDVLRVLQDLGNIELVWPVGQPLRIICEPFKNFRGTLLSEPLQNLKVRVEVNFFRRPRIVEFYPWEMERSEPGSSARNAAVHVDADDLYQSIFRLISDELKNHRINDQIFTVFEKNFDEVLAQQNIVVSRPERKRMMKNHMKRVLEELLELLH